MAKKSGAPFTVFLDRDGVFNVHPKMQVRRWKDFHFLPGAPEAHAALKAAGCRTCLITNQPGTGALLSTPGMIHRLHGHMQAELAKAGAPLDRIEAAFSPPWFPHRRLKPRPGMLEDAAAAFAEEGDPVDMGRAVMIGDKVKDAQAAAAFGIPAVVLATTYDAATLESKLAKKGVPYVAIVDDLPAAVELIRSWLKP